MAAAVKNILVTALCAGVPETQRRETRRFVQGLASDELEYIADFLGSCVLEEHWRPVDRVQLADRIRHFNRSRTTLHAPGARESNSLQDQEHKMILLLEYLCRSGLTRASVSVAAGQS